MALQFVTDQIKNAAITSAKVDLTGSFDYSSGTLRAATPSASTDVANKSYVDSVAQGLHWKDSVKAATTGNITLSGTQTIDGVAISAGERVLVKNQTSGAENGIYICAAGAWSRSTDMDAGTEFPGAAVFVRAGTTNADIGWVCTNDTVSLGSTVVAFAQFTGAGSLTAGNGIAISGNTVSARLAGSGGLEFSGGQMQIAGASVTEAMLAGSIGNAKLSNSAVTVTAGNGLSGGGSVSLGGSVSVAVSVDDSSIEINSDSLRLKDSGVTSAKLAGSIPDSKLNQVTTGDKVAGSAVELSGNTALIDSTGLKLKSGLAGDGLAIASAGGGQVLSINVDDSSIETNSDSLRIKALGVTNAMLAGSIADSKLSQITTADKVAGSALELSANTGLEDSTGLRFKAGVAGDGLAIASSGGNQVLSVSVDDSSIETNGDSLRVKGLGITNAMLAGSIVTTKVAFQPRFDSLSADGSTTAFNLGTRIMDANWTRSAMVVRNGQMLKIVANSPADVSEFTVADNGSNTVLTFGAAPLSGDVVQVRYIA